MMDEQPHVHDLVAAYVLGAVTPEEAALVQEHLATCATCRQFVRELHEVEAVLPELAGERTPPPALKARTMAVVEAEPRRSAEGSAAPGSGLSGVRDEDRLTPQQPDGAVAAPAPGRAGAERRSRRVYPLLALAAVLALAIILIAVWRLSGAGQPQPTRVYAMAGTPALRSIRGTLTYFKQGNRLQLDLHGLRQIPSNRVYELWLIRGTRVVKGVGEFRPKPDGSGGLTLHGQDVPSYTLAGLTIERAPRSAAPTKPIVAAATLGSH